MGRKRIVHGKNALVKGRKGAGGGKVDRRGKRTSSPFPAGNRHKVRVGFCAMRPLPLQWSLFLISAYVPLSLHAIVCHRLLQFATFYVWVALP